MGKNLPRVEGFLKIVFFMALVSVLFNLPAKKSLILDKSETAYINLCANNDNLTVGNYKKENPNKDLFVTCGGFL